MERPNRSKYNDKHKMTWVTLCYVQITVTWSAWTADQLTAVMKTKGYCFYTEPTSPLEPPGLSSHHDSELGDEVRGTHMLCQSPVG